MSQSHVVGFKVGDRYVLERLLGRGGNGEVWRARNDVTRGPVAIKIVTANGSDRQARGEQEAYVGANLNHRNLVRVYDAFHGKNGAFFLVMEALDGETLLTRLTRQGTLPVHDALAIAAGVLRGLSHAHELGVLHRDISTTNVFLANESNGRAVAKLLDFGLAKVARSTIQTADSDVLGTPQYMSPEQVRGKTLEPQADLFVVGILLYEMITGVCPFERNSAAACLAAVLEDTIDPHPQIPPRIWFVIQRALCKQPYERFRTANEFLEELERASDGPIDDTVPPTLYVRRNEVAAPPSVREPDITPVDQEGAERSLASVSLVQTPAPASFVARRSLARQIVGGIVGVALLATAAAGWKSLRPTKAIDGSTPAAAFVAPAGSASPRDALALGAGAVSSAAAAIADAPGAAASSAASAATSAGAPASTVAALANAPTAASARPASTASAAPALGGGAYNGGSAGRPRPPPIASNSGHSTRPPVATTPGF